ncbi:class I adenylate-forming enzyme family protein [Paraburkholderia humisilvae]|uniref:Long-chain-fatty-acid--CoA ligase n=1 Tax=Paraburkholderia humisilvae TaxID=627669 RepID=A0A6J5E5Z0_9BURK|nr:class I adenylate-forming enzyme family protein [Paraburkholderia humisilvae]CAB3761347.1 Long-chain-fatty-acid--CoA ligase [Paraburkholderia humisilvae]
MLKKSDPASRAESLADALCAFWSEPQVGTLTALDDGDRSLTYAQLADMTAKVAANLFAQGLKQGDALAIAMGRSLDAVIVLLASIRCGLCPCVLEPKLPPEEIGERLALVAAKGLVFDAANGELVQALELEPGNGALAIDVAQLNKPIDAARQYKIDTQSPALLLFTSGSTGRPKAVELTQCALLNNALGVIEHTTLSRQDRLLHVMPIYHTNGVNNQLFAPLLAGATIIFAERFRAEDMPALIERHRPTIITGVPTMYSRMLSQSFSPAMLASLRMARCGSAPITEALHREVEARLGCPLVVSYGLSEATCTSTMNPPHARRIGSVGTVLRGQSVQLRQADGAMTDAPGVEGEISIAGRSVMTGYLGAEDATARTVSDGWLRTGDLGRFDADGYLYVTGRIKDVIIRGGENLSPLLIESVIVSETHVRACCVVGKPDHDLGEVPVAVVVTGSDSTLQAQDIVDSVRRRLSRIYVPHEVYFVDALPETAVGKVDRKSLAGLVRDGLLQAVV